MNRYIEAHTTCLPGDTGEPFTSDEPELRIEVQTLTGFEWRLGRLVLQLPILPSDVG